MAGSSPLTRGAPSSLAGLGCLHRLIPAHAGSTSLGRLRPAPNPAHPRSRGEHRRYDPADNEDWGSSPLTRGALGYWHPRRPHRRLIPAHAGSTKPSSGVRKGWRAHPRSRGEHTAARKYSTATAGSSPLTRGALGVDVIEAEDMGLIPAHAGSTVWLRPRCRDVPAHPRSRGEHAERGRIEHLGGGSSPLTRGALVASRYPPGLEGLIPAHAGSTHGGTGDRVERTAHPRSRGEHSAASSSSAAKRGSSPLTRGAPWPPR